MIARWACIPFSWVGAIVCYLWARDLYGRPAGVFACLIWCFEPNILAHAALITPDARERARAWKNSPSGPWRKGTSANRLPQAVLG
jgi:hypothetical protein